MSSNVAMEHPELNGALNGKITEVNGEFSIAMLDVP